MKTPVQVQPGERLLLLLRRHWMYFYPRLILLLLITLVPPAGLLYVMDRAEALDDVWGKIAIGAAITWLVLWGARTYFTWYRYQNDMWMITDQRLVDSLRKHWFHHSIASADLVDVEDVSVHRSGLFGTTFNDGDVRVQTAGQQANFVLSGIPKPSAVLTQIDAARDASRRDVARSNQPPPPSEPAAASTAPPP